MRNYLTEFIEKRREIKRQQAEEERHLWDERMKKFFEIIPIVEKAIQDIKPIMEKGSTYEQVNNS